MASLQEIREFINQSLHNPCTKKARFINGILTFLIIFSVALIPVHFVENIFDLDPWVSESLHRFEKLVVTIFTLEYVLRFWSARFPVKYVTSWWGLIDLVAILPFYLAEMGIGGSPEAFLMLRILRILKFGKVYGMERYAIECAKGAGHGHFHALPNEEVERIVQKHPLILLAHISLPLLSTSIGLTILIFLRASNVGIILATLFFGFAVLFFIKTWLDYNYDVIYITNRRIIVQNRQLFGSTSNDVSYEAITNVVPDNVGFWHWILGLGHIRIETASMEGQLLFENVGKPHEVMHKISENRQKAHMKKEKEAEALRQAVPSFLDQQIPPQNPGVNV